MGAGAGLHCDDASGLAGQERQHLISSQLLSENDFARSIGAMRLEDRLGQIEPDYANFTHGRLLCSGVLNTSTLALSMPSGGVHPIVIGTSAFRISARVLA
jgi:hypothetical protein